MSNKIITLEPGDYLFKEGDLPTDAYIVEMGFLEVNATQDSKLITLGSLKRGDIVGEMAVIDNNPRSANVIASTSCKLVVINKDQFAERLKNSDPIVRSLLDGLLRRYRSAMSSLRGEGNFSSTGKTTLFKKQTFDKLRLESQLKEALSKHELDLRFQPILDLNHNKIAGYEALIRWEHSENGFISPDEFITLAEETNLISEVGRYVIEKSCLAINTLIEAGVTTHPFVAVNVSPKQLNDKDFIANVAQCIQEHKLSKGSLRLEITESLTSEINSIHNVLQECNKYSIPVALDDFGTGYSNLTQLHTLKYDTIKVDQAFSRGFEHNERSIILVKGIIGMCHSLGADALIEGIETATMLSLAKELNCKYAQGYFIGQPQHLDDLLKNIS